MVLVRQDSVVISCSEGTKVVMLRGQFQKAIERLLQRALEGTRGLACVGARVTFEAAAASSAPHRLSSSRWAVSASERN